MKSPARAERLYLSDARDAIDRIVAYTSEGHAHFVADPKTQDAVVRNLEIIGEAVKHVTPATRAGMRDRLIHDYFRVDLNIAWDVVTNDLAPLRDALTALVDGA